MIPTLVQIIKQEKTDFKELERLLWRACTGLFQHLMEEILVRLDEEFRDERDKSRYENREQKGRTIETAIGGIHFKRRYYWDKEKKRRVFLLDEQLSIEAEKTIGPGLLELAVTWATKGPSYRDAQNRLIDLYGAQLVSHETIRQALLEVGAACERKAENKIVRKQGTKDVEALFIEVDGFGARFQKNEKRNHQNRRREVKMAVIHEGWAPRNNGKKSDYRLVNAHYVSNLKESDDFWEHVRGIINAEYKDIDNTLIVINGDGAPWIREGAMCFARGMYQYDRFHVSRELREAFRFNEEAMRKARKALSQNDLGSLAIITTEALLGCRDTNQREKLEEFKDLLIRDQDSIIDYRVRLRNSGVCVPTGWRGLGAAESNVNKFKNRTAKQGRAWSPEGLTAILTTLSRLFEDNLSKTLTRTLEEKEEWLLDRVKSGVGHALKGLRDDGPGVRSAGFPAINTGTKGYAKLFRSLQRVEFS